eukprot:CAMPEP_0180147948 /NCGR_PEP_ID=MMETSP0986-20121125/19649_1 /TAXON_ID=697907 /ORGANISM="non described non described, Strain CCMP2293" /LENGTH=70 /DNA_ID=CAMNT_0022093773 /DNA_START=101 /DNA_END=313 /DNA_ORIENTATION=-
MSRGTPKVSIHLSLGPPYVWSTVSTDSMNMRESSKTPRSPEVGKSGFEQLPSFFQEHPSSYMTWLCSVLQ